MALCKFGIFCVSELQPLEVLKFGTLYPKRLPHLRAPLKKETHTHSNKLSNDVKNNNNEMKILGII